jgi:hypothetical protein
MLKEPVVERLIQGNDCFSAQHIPGAGHNIRREQFELYMKAVQGFFS